MAASVRLRSCSDQKQMPMRKTRVRERRPRIEPTSRPSDLVCLIFSRPNCDAALNLVQTYLPSFQGKVTAVRRRQELRRVGLLHSHVRAREERSACYLGVGLSASSGVRSGGSYNHDRRNPHSIHIISATVPPLPVFKKSNFAVTFG